MIQTARRMISCARPYDTVGRYGGEEFLIVVPASGSKGAIELAERIRKAIESKPFITDAGTIHVTGSFGVAISHLEDQLDTQELIRLADDALYRGKDHGRNRSELANSRLVPEPSSVTA